MSKERWKPEIGEYYWFVQVGSSILVHPIRFDEDNWAGDYYASGNCFKTKEEAEKVAEKFRKLLADNSEESERTNLPKLTAEVFDRKDCPKWAKWAAISKFGCLTFFEVKPILGDNSFISLNENYTNKLYQNEPGQWDASDWKNSLIERPVKKPKRPDWMEYEKWFYFRGNYVKLFDISEEQNIISLDFLSGNRHVYSPKEVYTEAVEARLCPYSPDEMKSLVGKVLCYNTGSYLVTAFENRWNQVKIESTWRDADELKKGWTRLDGIPCGHFEHLNDKGEWVE